MDRQAWRRKQLAQPVLAEVVINFAAILRKGRSEPRPFR
jgi:hypothetical protein